MKWILLRKASWKRNQAKKKAKIKIPTSSFTSVSKLHKYAAYTNTKKFSLYSRLTLINKCNVKPIVFSKLKHFAFDQVNTP